MPKRFLKYVIVGHHTPPVAGFSLADDGVSTLVSTGLLTVDVLANDTLPGPCRITAVTAIGSAPPSAFAIIGAEPTQQVQVNRAGLAAGVYQAEYRVELIADPAQFATATLTVTVTATTLPTVSIAAPSPASIAEGNSGTKSIVFTAARTGDLSQASSVQWALEGGLNAADMATGQATSGTLSWAISDAANKTITIVVKGDTTVEPDEICRIRISSPVGCVIGTATATVTIADDDDSTPGPTEYDDGLAFGGMMLGTPIQDGSVGNLQFPQSQGTNNALVVYLESLLPIACIQTENRYDKFPLSSRTSNTGYSDHGVVLRGGNYDDVQQPESGTLVQQAQGGDIRWRVTKVTSAEGVTPLTVDTVVGATRRIVRCATRTNWKTDYESSGGSGVPPAALSGADNSFVMYPTIWFRDEQGNPAPVDPVALGWKIGDRIAFIVDSNASDSYGGSSAAFSRQVAPDLQTPARWTGQSRWSSVNLAHRDTRDSPRSTYRLMRHAGAWWRNFRLDARYLPMLLIGHQRPDGTLLVKGCAYGGYAGDDNYHVLSGSVGTGCRQVLYIPSQPGWSKRKIIAADVSIFRTSGTTGSFKLSIRKAGSNPGASGDNGTEIGAATFTSALNATSSSPNTTSGEAHRRVTLDTPFAVEPGEAYYIEVSIVSGSAGYSICRLLNYYGRQPIGLNKADHQDSRNIMQRRTGSGNWTTMPTPGVASNYALFGMSLHFDVDLSQSPPPPATALNPTAGSNITSLLNGLSAGSYSLPAGTFFATSVALKSGVKITGAGKGVTIIKLPNGSYTTSNFAVTVLNFAGKSGVELSDLTLDGNRFGQTIANNDGADGGSPGFVTGTENGGWHTVRMENSSGFTFRNVALINGGTDGLYLDGGGGHLFEDCDFLRNRRQGCSPTKIESTTTFRRCKFNGTGNRPGVEAVTLGNQDGGCEPMAGVDIEPNSASDHIINLRFEDCETRQNGFAGFMIDTRSGAAMNINGMQIIGHTSTGNGTDSLKLQVRDGITNDCLVQGGTFDGKISIGGGGSSAYGRHNNLIVENIAQTGNNIAVDQLKAGSTVTIRNSDLPSGNASVVQTNIQSGATVTVTGNT